jgi:XTP/dITP diphosphohydrolase
MTPKLLVATHNAGKAREFEELFAGLVLVETLALHPDIEMPPEDADSFESNARTKAEFVASKLSIPVLADDSGLCVDALGGAPGVRSARYALGTDQDRVTALLRALAAVPTERRTAHFACAMALAAPGRPTSITLGRVEGRIAREPRGSGGFGYDPVFEVLEIEEGRRTMAELLPEEKHALSHRGRAAEKMKPLLFSLELGGPNT